ncbi:MAG: MYXO-CTERM sorting domain-containing protein, partial [Myxococcota bacterium]|nr:MYXO-CTERM sorting domain-containing protein [Myxococcota bacterium]
GGEDSGEGAPEDKGEPEDWGDCETVDLPGFCGPQWLAPCEVDADCGGTGFACVEDEVCWATGSDSSAGSMGSSGSAGDMSTDPAPPEDEEAEDKKPAPGDDEGDDDEFEESGCEGTGTFYCEIQEIPCTDSADCPTGWDCLENSEAAVSVSMAVPCDVDEDGNEDCPEAEAEPAEPADISSLCFPAGYEDYASWGEGDLSIAAENAANDADPGSTTNPTGPEDGQEGGESASNSSSSSSDDGGCAGGPQPLSALWLALALVALAVRRREPIGH